MPTRPASSASRDDDVRRATARGRARMSERRGVADARELAQRAVGEDHRPGQLGDELLHRLAHPPGGVGPERRAERWVVALERAEEADDAVLHQLGPVDGADVAVSRARPTPTSGRNASTSSSRAPGRGAGRPGRARPPGVVLADRRPSAPRTETRGRAVLGADHELIARCGRTHKELAASTTGPRSVSHRRASLCADARFGAALSDPRRCPLRPAYRARRPPLYPGQRHATGLPARTSHTAGRGAYRPAATAPSSARRSGPTTSRRSATSRPRSSPARRGTRSAKSCSRIDLDSRPSGLLWAVRPHDPHHDSCVAVRPGEHACCRFAQAADRGDRDGLRVRGLTRGDKTIYLGDRDPEELVAELAADDDRVETAIESGSSTSARPAAPTRRRAASTSSACSSPRARSAIARSPRATPRSA